MTTKPPTKLPTMDDLAKSFLGIGKGTNAKVVPGQTANPERQQALYEQELAHEACDFGDVLVNYVGSHVDVPVAHRAFGVALGVLNLRSEYPNGGEQFDELADLGGEDLQVETKKKAPVVAPVGAAAVTARLDEASILAAAPFAGVFVRYVTMKKHQLGLSNPQTSYALGRTFHNLRVCFPPEDGGPATFDQYAKQAGEYFNRG